MLSAGIAAAIVFSFIVVVVAVVAGVVGIQKAGEWFCGPQNWEKFLKPNSYASLQTAGQNTDCLSKRAFPNFAESPHFRKSSDGDILLTCAPFTTATPILGKWWDLHYRGIRLLPLDLHLSYSHSLGVSHCLVVKCSTMLLSFFSVSQQTCAKGATNIREVSSNRYLVISNLNTVSLLLASRIKKSSRLARKQWNKK